MLQWIDCEGSTTKLATVSIVGNFWPNPRHSWETALIFVGVYPSDCIFDVGYGCVSGCDGEVYGKRRLCVIY